jgi:hypothetical protein
MNQSINANDLLNAVVARSQSKSPQEPSHEMARMPKGKEKLHGFSRSYLYALEKAGLIRTVQVLMPGKSRGIRLVDVASLRAFIASQVPASNE